MNYQRTANWLKACDKKPGDRIDLSVQIGCHLEETVEFLKALSLHMGNSTALALQQSIVTLTHVSDGLKKCANVAYIPDHLRAAALDALCDCEVTGNGVAYLAGFNKPEADRRVLDANDAKLVDGKPVILPGGKIGKCEGWTAPDLEDLV